MNKLFVFVLIVMFAIPCLGRSGSIENGEKIANQSIGGVPACAICHQADGAGNAAAGFPRLAGLNEHYMTQQLNSFLDGSRVNPVMQASIQGLESQQLADVSAYYASLPIPKMPAVTVTEEQLARGQQLVEHGDWSKYVPSCQSCHGPGNNGVGDTFPALAGQHAGYLKQQLLDWQKDVRQNDPNQLMIYIAKRMDAEDIDAVTAYLASLTAQKR